MRCGGRRGAAGLRCGATTTGQRRRGDVVARSWGGRKWWIATRGGILWLQRIEPDDLLDRGLLELEVLQRQPLDALGLVEVSPFDAQDVRGLLAFDDLLVGAVDLLLEVLHLVLDPEQPDRRGDGGGRPEQESAMDHARPP